MPTDLPRREPEKSGYAAWPYAALAISATAAAVILVVLSAVSAPRPTFEARWLGDTPQQVR